MDSAADASATFRFGAARLDTVRRQLFIDGQPARVGARAFDVLLALIERRSRAVTKDELFEVVWRGSVVEENNLQVHISTLRKLLGPQAITTIPGRGYRFTVDIEAAEAPAVSSSIDQSAPAQSQEPLFGRDEDLATIAGMLRKHALVSICGPGGIGKTRLASAIAAAQRENFYDGVWWIELAAISDPELVFNAVAQAIGVSASDQRPLRETVIALLSNQTALLVLDNCEHLLDAAIECVQTITMNAPGVRVLVTTQAALRIPGEHIYRLGGLDTDGSPDSPGAACALFIARAQAADPRLQPSEIPHASVVEICRRLDGMPLAIELAAARVRLLGTEGVRARLDERFHILTGGTRVTMRRHQTLRATLEWSHGLLSPAEQAVFRRLGVFAGGFTLELAQEVACDEQVDRWAVLDLLGQLIDKSLVVVDGNNPPRYQLLESMRAVALEKLAEAGETPALMRRHAEALLTFMHALYPKRHLLTREERTRCSAELDNLRSALAWSESQAGDRALGCALFARSIVVWFAYGPMIEAIERALRLSPLPAGTSPEIEADFNLMLAHSGYVSARNDCYAAALRAAELYRASGNSSDLLDAVFYAGMIACDRGERKVAEAAITEAETLVGPHTAPAQAARVALLRANNAMYARQFEKAIECALQQAEFFSKSKGNEWAVQIAFCNVAIYECGLGRFDSAIARLRTALDLLQRIKASTGVHLALINLTIAHALRGDRDQALALGRQAAPGSQRLGWTPRLLVFIALSHARHADEARAACLVGYTDATCASVGRVPVPHEADARDEAHKRALAALSPADFQRYTAAGRAMSEERAIEVAFTTDHHIDDLLRIDHA